MFLAEAEQGYALPSCFSLLTINKHPFCGVFVSLFLYFLSFFEVISLFKMSPNHSNHVLSMVPKKVAMCLTENICLLDKLHSVMSYSVLVVSSMLTAQQSILNKVSFNRNMHKARLHMDYLMKM